MEVACVYSVHSIHPPNGDSACEHVRGRRVIVSVILFMSKRARW